MRNETQLNETQNLLAAKAERERRAARAARFTEAGGEGEGEEVKMADGEAGAAGAEGVVYRGMDINASSLRREVDASVPRR